MSSEALDYGPVVQTARDYYNSADADNFYYTVWGGEDIHIGLYRDPQEAIAVASQRTVERMLGLSQDLDATSRVLDLGAGYGGAARQIVKSTGARVAALNLSEVENRRNRQLNQDQGLADRIEVVDGSFEFIPFPGASFDVVWSQDAILHSADRGKVLQETARVLKPGGRFIFTDIMQTDDCPAGVLQPILDRIHLDTLGTPRFYRETAASNGLIEVGFEDHTDQLVTHYGRVLAETQAREAELDPLVSAPYRARMKTGLQHWVDGGRNGHLAWGIFQFQKTA